MTSTRLNLARALLASILASTCVACGPDHADIESSKHRRYDRGRQLAADGSWPEAIIEFNAALQVDQRFGKAHYAVAQAYDQTAQATKAMNAYIRAADALPGNLDAQVKAATFLLAARMYSDAAAGARKALAIDPRSVAAHIVLGNALSGLGRLDDAVNELREAIELEPDKGQLYTNLGLLQAANTRQAEAERTFKRAIEMDPFAVSAHLALANFYWSGERTSEAEARLKDALAIEPSHALANRALAQLYLASGRPREAEAPMTALADVSSDPSDRLALAALYLRTNRVTPARHLLTTVSAEPGGAALAAPRLAGLAYAERHPQQAYAILDDVLAKEPENAAVLLVKGRLLSLDGRSDEAKAVVNAAVKAHPERAAGHYALGVLQQAEHDLDGARRSFTETIRLNPRAAQAQTRLAQIALGRGATDAALPMAQAALRARPLDIDTRLVSVRSLTAAGLLRKADAELRTLLADHPTVAAAHAAAGSLHTMRGDREAARRSYDKALELQPDSIEGVAGLVNVDMIDGRILDARARITAAVAETPGSVPLQLMAGVVYKATGDSTASERSFKRAIALDPSNIQASAALGQLYFSLGRLDDARRELEGISRRDPTSATGATMVGMILEAEGMTTEAKQRYENVLQRHPDSVVAANNLAWLYLRDNEQLDRALELAQHARRQAPDDPQIADTLAWVYVTRGLAATALPLLQEVVDAQPDEASFQFHLGVAYAAIGDQARAREALDATLALDETYPGAQDAREALAHAR